MAVAESLKPNRPKIADEYVDNEVIIIDFDTGNYFSVVGLAAEVWQRLVDGQEVSQIRGDLAGRFADAQPGIEAEVDTFLGDLVANGMVVEGTHSEDGAVDVPQAAEYTPLAVQEYSDMKDLLLLDPIHEVDAAGWPVVAPETDN